MMVCGVQIRCRVMIIVNYMFDHFIYKLPNQQLITNKKYIATSTLIKPIIQSKIKNKNKNNNTKLINKPL